jgi:prepilin-type N-terminal cleavage/methylation domain-containing protein
LPRTGNWGLGTANCRRRARPAGFTLAEILTALAIMVIGLSAIIGVLYTSFLQGRIASDRNAAAILFPETIRQIELEHRVTEDGPYKGLLVETVDDAAGSGRVSDQTYPLSSNLVRSEAGEDGLSDYPRADRAPLILPTGPYRFRYRLEKRTDPPEYAGLYVLSLVCYRDNEMNALRLVQVSDPVTVYLRQQ